MVDSVVFRQRNCDKHHVREMKNNKNVWMQKRLDITTNCLIPGYIEYHNENEPSLILI